MTKSYNHKHPRYERLAQRHANFKKAFQLLESAVQEGQTRQFSDLENEGVIQRFEFTFELAWKVLKDYLLAEHVSIEHLTPRTVIKVAISVNIIKAGDDWLNALEDRNLMSHTYDYAKFEQVIAAIRDRYLLCFATLQVDIEQVLLNEAQR
jgi:nucleotidyltransferase substrate binding protein (TIGR01987 family)